MEDVELPDLDDDPTGASEPGDPVGISGPVDTGRVVEVALHLDDHPELSIAEVDAADPAVVVAHVDLTFESFLAGVPEERYHPVLEPALDRSVTGATLEREPPDGGGASRTTTTGEGGDVLVQLPDLQEVPSEHALAGEVEPLPVEPTGEVADGAQRRRHRDPSQVDDVVRAEAHARVDDSEVRPCLLYTSPSPRD